MAKVAQIIDFLSYFEEGHIQCKISVATFYTTLWGNWATFILSSGHTGLVYKYDLCESSRYAECILKYSRALKNWTGSSKFVNNKIEGK